MDEGQQQWQQDGNGEQFEEHSAAWGWQLQDMLGRLMALESATLHLQAAHEPREPQDGWEEHAAILQEQVNVLAETLQAHGRESKAALRALRERIEGPSSSQPAAPREQRGGNWTVFVGNLDYKASEADLFKVLRHVGGVLRVHIVRDWDSGRSRGCAFVEFMCFAAKQRALHRKGLVLNRRVLRLAEPWQKRWVPKQHSE